MIYYSKKAGGFFDEKGIILLECFDEEVKVFDGKDIYSEQIFVISTGVIHELKKAFELAQKIKDENEKKNTPQLAEYAVAAKTNVLNLNNKRKGRR